MKRLLRSLQGFCRNEHEGKESALAFERLREFWPSSVYSGFEQRFRVKLIPPLVDKKQSAGIAQTPFAVETRRASRRNPHHKRTLEDRRVQDRFEF